MTFPNRIRVVEVGPRDGFQNLKNRIETKDKLQEIELLIQSGVQEMEVTSFVHPKAIPQMFDSAQVAQEISSKYGDRVRLIALVPNAKGAERAMENGIHTVTYVISASEAHNKANVNRSVRESCENLAQLTDQFPDLTVRLDIATAFGCPFRGAVSMEEVYYVADFAANRCGVKELVFCDTIGVANPAQVSDFAQKVLARYPDLSLGMHLHDTRGMGLANTVAAMEQGITLFESSVGGLGGCPFAPGAAGNTATEDMLNMLHAMGVDTGISFDQYMKAVQFVQEHIQQELTSHLCNVCTGVPAGN